MVRWSLLEEVVVVASVLEVVSEMEVVVVGFLVYFRRFAGVGLLMAAGFGGKVFFAVGVWLLAEEVILSNCSSPRAVRARSSQVFEDSAASSISWRAGSSSQSLSVAARSMFDLIGRVCSSKLVMHATKDDEVAGFSESSWLEVSSVVSVTS